MKTTTKTGREASGALDHMPASSRDSPYGSDNSQTTGVGYSIRVSAGVR